MMGVSAQKNSIHLAIAAWRWDAYFSPEARMQGIRMAFADWRRPAPETAPVKSKAAGLYMICTLSKHKAEAAGYNDALMLDYRGRIAEATGANIFLVQDGELHTPDPDCFLNGITRQVVIEIARTRGYTVHERAIMPEELTHTDEVFITGTAVEVTPVREIGDNQFTVGPVTKDLLTAFDDLVQGRKSGNASVSAA
jgi:branched-chain amino acid aminotransferase